MNAFDRCRLRFTCWCEDCDMVFDSIQSARIHSGESNHRIKVTEFLVTGKGNF